MPLRQFCAHSSLIESKGNFEDLKYSLLFDKLSEIILNKRKAIVFTHFTKLIEKIYTDINKNYKNIYVNYIYGKVKPEKRQIIIDKFTEHNGAGVLVANAETAGVGLNITTANYVFLYTPDWKPSAESQALKRVHRIGQKRDVFVYKMFYSKTVEEVMREKVERKKMLGDALIKGITNSDEIDLKKIIHISPLNN